MTAFRDVFERFVATHASKEMKRLMSATVLLDFALAAIGLFEPIYLYTLHWSLASISFFYFAVYALTFLILPIGARFAGRVGFRHSILFSTPFLIAYYLALYAIPRHPIFIVFAVVAYALQKCLYWPGFDSEMAASGHDGERGREISNLTSLTSMAAILGPSFGGVLLGAYGFTIGFAVTGLMMLVSNLPLLSMPPERARDGLPYLAAIKRVFAKEHRGFTTALMGFGEEYVSMIIWPIFLYVTLRGFAATGVVVSISIMLSTLAILFIGRLSDLQSRHAVLRTGSFFTAFSWIVRPLLTGATGVLFGDFFYRVSRTLLGIPLVALVYERAGKGPLLERVALYEMGVFFGKAAIMLLGTAMALLLPGNFTAFFVLAALVSLLYSRLP
ncbi:MAG TPA: MFS transporter [Candidatus Baltobacteraceae bacterium]|nr:MFS transporter [Candidatus Baltobacteraceae bacterium]